jgi:hypothetical protein
MITWRTDLMIAVFVLVFIGVIALTLMPPRGRHRYGRPDMCSRAWLGLSHVLAE